MNREWQPGDVALIGWAFTSGMERAIRLPDDGWVTESGITVYKVTKTCPLVVIDPEDREQVEQLLRTIHGGPRGSSRWLCHNADDLAAALREFANPKPPRCAARISVDYGEHAASDHECERAEAHEGPHSNATLTWTAVSS